MYGGKKLVFMVLRSIPTPKAKPSDLRVLAPCMYKDTLVPKLMSVNYISKIFAFCVDTSQ